MSALRELRERVEKATGPDREIDGEIDAALFGGVAAHLCRCPTRQSYSKGWVFTVDNGRPVLIEEGHPAEPYTASLDAVLALVERVLPGWRKRFTDLGPCWRAELWREGRDARHIPAEGRTLVLAVLSALLAAREALEP